MLKEIIALSIMAIGVIFWASVIFEDLWKDKLKFSRS